MQIALEACVVQTGRRVMNDALAQFQQQMQALEASAHQQLAWMVISVVALNILT